MKKTHGMTARPYTATKYPRIFGIWKNMKQRCLNPHSPRYGDYGGRGIRICKRWLKFENFYADMGSPPKGKTLDRKNNTGHYTKRNCRWAVVTQQAQNSRRAKVVRIGKTSLCISEWCRRTGITYGVYKARLRAGWSQEKALTTAAKRQYNNVYPRSAL